MFYRVNMSLIKFHEKIDVMELQRESNNLKRFMNENDKIYFCVLKGEYTELDKRIKRCNCINKKLWFGKCLIHHAVERGNLRCLEILINNGADIKIKCTDNKTPLHYAAEHGNLNLLNYFASQYKCVNIKDNYGNTPLLLAIYTNNSECVLSLLNFGANIYIKNIEKKCALDLECNKFIYDIIRHEHFCIIIDEFCEKHKNKQNVMCETYNICDKYNVPEDVTLMVCKDYNN